MAAPPIIHTDSGALVSRLIPDDPLPYVRQSRMIWGINGHPVMKMAYISPEGVDDQFKYLDSLRVTYYRVDVRPDTVRGDLMYYGLPVGSILDIADRHHIKILPVITNVPDMTERPGTQSIEVNRRAGYRIGYTVAAKYGSRLTHIEAGNELDNLSLRTGDGSDLSHYDSTALARTIAFIRGMTEGIRAGAPGVKIIINSGGWRHYAFLNALEREHIDYDVVGYHWYSRQGDIDAPIGGGRSVLDHLVALRKDIWITEINRSNGSFEETPPHDQAYWIAKYVRDYYRFEAVKAFFVYELYDENEFIDHPDTVYTEAYYGLIACQAGELTCLGPKRIKPAFDAYRYGIEEQVYGYEDYTYQLFTHVLRRPPTSAELSAWTKRLISLGRESRTGLWTFAKALLQASMPTVVRDAYHQLLGHDPSPDAVAHWTDQMARGRSVRDLMIEICGSDEFWMLSGATDDGFIGRVYRLVIGREPDAGERTALVEQLAAGTPREAVVGAALNSRVFQGILVDTQYQALLGRAPDPTERSRGIERLHDGLSWEGLILDLLCTTEYWNNAVRAGYWRRTQSAVGP